MKNRRELLKKLSLTTNDILLGLIVFFILYGISRFIIDFFRYYETSMVILPFGDRGLSLNQGISMTFVLLGIVLIAMGNMKYKKMQACR